MSAGVTSEPIAQLDTRLLHYLRACGAGPEVDYASAPARIYGGNETFVYRLRLSGAAGLFAQPLVLRLYRSHHDPRRAARESRIQEFVAARGFPAARVLAFESDCSVLGGAFVLMQELDGEPYLGSVAAPDASGLPRWTGVGALLRGAGDMWRVPQILASVERRLHALDGEALLEEVRAAGEDESYYVLDGLLAPQAELVERALPGLRASLDWLVRERPSDPERRVICHGDVQPLNILMRDGSVTGVVDWGHTIVADAHYELGRMSCAIRVVPLPAPGPAQPAIRRIQRVAADQYLRGVALARPLDDKRLRYYQALMAFLARSWHEEQRVAGRNDPDAFNSPEAQRRVAEVFRENTGIAWVL